LAMAHLGQELAILFGLLQLRLCEPDAFRGIDHSHLHHGFSWLAQGHATDANT